MNKNEIIIINREWTGICFIESSKRLYRKNLSNEYGTYEIDNNKLIITWDNWEKEEFYKIDKNKYIISNLFFSKYLYIDFYDKINMKNTIVFNIEENIFYTFDKKNNLQGKYIIDSEYIVLYFENYIEKKYIKINDEIYFLNDEYLNIFFELCIDNKIFLFNKTLGEFYDKKMFKKMGKFQMLFDKLTLLYNSENKEVYYVKNVYKSNNSYINKNQENLNIIYPKKIKIDNRVLFSNITLYKKKIILTSIYYKENPWIINNLFFTIKNNQIINKTIYEHNHFESSVSIILYLEKEEEKLDLTIDYNHNNKSYFFDISLTQSFNNINNLFLSAMTLFKDDYKLLHQYIKYYDNLGIKFFFLY
jgi:hypothetical protein